MTQSQVDVAFYQKKSSKWATLFQIFTIVFTLAVIILGDRMTLYFENQDLNRRVEEYKKASTDKNQKAMTAEQVIKDKDNLIAKLQSEIQSLRNVLKK